MIESSIDKEMSEETLDTRVDPIERVTGIIEQIMDLERCSSTSVQLVQLPTQPNAPGVSMDRNTGDTPIVKITEDMEQTMNPE